MVRAQKKTEIIIVRSLEIIHEFFFFFFIDLFNLAAEDLFERVQRLSIILIYRVQSIYIAMPVSKLFIIKLVPSMAWNYMRTCTTGRKTLKAQNEFKIDACKSNLSSGQYIENERRLLPSPAKFDSFEFIYIKEHQTHPKGTNHLPFLSKKVHLTNITLQIP